MYTIPEMPLQVPVWWTLDALPPNVAAAQLIAVSLSPINPSLAFSEGFAGTTPPTHIIRALNDTRWSDNYVPGAPSNIFPCTVIECPADTGHFYATIWAHICGFGFPNAHVRAYAIRLNPERVLGKPLYSGYV